MTKITITIDTDVYTLIKKEVLAIAQDCAIEVANDVHERFKGYKPTRHAAVDFDLKQIQDSIAAVPADLPGVVTHSGEYFEVRTDGVKLYTHAGPVEVEQLRQRVMQLNIKTESQELSIAGLKQVISELDAQLAAQPKTEMNQCDGCRTHSPLRNGLHIDMNGRAFMTCQKDKYVQPTPEAIVEWTRRACQVAVEDALNDEDDPLAAIELLDLSAIIQAAKEGR